MGRSAVFARSVGPRGQAKPVPAVLHEVGTLQATRCATATAATTFLFLAGLVVVPNTGAQGDPATDPAYETGPTTTWYDPYFVEDPYYDETSNPTYDPYDGTYYDDGTYYSEDPCDPAFHPDWESDPYCNPALQDPTFDAAAPSPTVLAFSNGRTAAFQADQDPVDVTVALTDLELDEAVQIGAWQMLLAIDGLAELGAFERTELPSGAALLHDIRDSIPADGLTNHGYIAELSRFEDDFMPFLEWLEASGLEVSEDLWIAAEDLSDLAFAADGIESGATAIMEPGPWLAGVGDLLVRSGAAGSAADRDDDAVAIRTLLADFAMLADTPATTVTTDTTAPPATEPAVIDSDPIAEEPESSAFPFLWLALAVLAAITGALVLNAGRGSRREDEPDSASDRAGAAAPGTVTDAPPVADPAPDSEAAAIESSQHATSVSDLLDASRRMTSALDVTSIASIALSEALRLTDAEGGIVVRRTDDGPDPIACEPPMLFNYDRIADGCLPRIMETGRSVTSIAQDEPLLVEVPMAMAAVPIVADGIVTGAILVVRVSARPFSRDEVDSLEMLAPLAGSAFAAADTHESATELRDVEPLTGLQNRRRLDLDLAAISPDDQVAYVMVDIDHFKNFNDTNGHAAGDAALRRVSELLSASVRPMDLVYRYGGEEFCVLLPGATAEAAAVVAERARSAVENAVIPGMENQPDGRVTISVGVSDSAWGSPDDLVERADAALYEAKRNGRNRVSLHQP